MMHKNVVSKEVPCYQGRGARELRNDIAVIWAALRDMEKAAIDRGDDESVIQIASSISSIIDVYTSMGRIDD